MAMMRHQANIDLLIPGLTTTRRITVFNCLTSLLPCNIENTAFETSNLFVIRLTEPRSVVL